MSSAMPFGFWQWLSSLPRSDQMPTLVGIISILAGAAVLITAILAITYYKVHRNRLCDSLKRELMERGTPAEDIATIVRAMPTKSERADY